MKIPIFVWSELKDFSAVYCTDHTAEIRNSGGKTYIVTVINKPNNSLEET